MAVVTFAPAIDAGLDLRTCTQAPTPHGALYFLGHSSHLACTVCTPGSVPAEPVTGWGYVVIGSHHDGDTADTDPAAAVAQAARSTGACVVVSTSGPLLRESLLRGVADVVVLGKDHASRLPVPAGMDAAGWLRRQGVGVVVAATGKGRVVLEDGRGRMEARLPDREGLGQDSCLMAAGYVAGVMRGLDQADRLRLAAACAWATPRQGRVSPVAVGRVFRQIHTADA